MQLKKILLPVDLSGAKPRLAQQAAFVARHFAADIVLLHVMHSASYPAALLQSARAALKGEHDDFEHELMRSVQVQLESTLSDELEGISVKRLLARGDVASQIEQTALDEGVDLIMMPTHSHDVTYRFLIGSVTAKVLHRSPSPLWTDAYIPSDSSYRFSVQRLLCAIELGAHSAHTLMAAHQIAAAFDAQLTLVHVTPSVETYGPGGSVPVPGWREELYAGARSELERLQQQAGTHYQIIIDSGNVPEALNRAAQATRADVLVLGRLPAGGHLGANGAGYALVRDSVVPVLSI
jgi:nucleotide-binding universal stress UspA family protein